MSIAQGITDAYGNSSGDLPLLRRARHAYWVTGGEFRPWFASHRPRPTTDCLMCPTPQSDRFALHRHLRCVVVCALMPLLSRFVTFW